MGAMIALTLSVLALVSQQTASLATRAIGEVDHDQLRAWHDRAAGQPHVAGTAGDRAQIEWMAKAFDDLGLEVERQELWLYLCRPVAASLTVLHAGDELELSLREPGVEGDALVDDERLSFGWNAYSGSGTATGEVVFANRGRKEDFEHLARLGVDCSGKIVVARYGGNYRGYKAKYAEAAGAAGLVIYTDPADSGYGRGREWPEGGWANERSIQRGSILTLPYYGDPQTPFRESTRDAERLAPDELALPKIPVQPIGWGAAAEILARMDGADVPEGWSGGLRCAYRLTGGSELRVRVSVEQERLVLPTANVLGTLVGRESPDEFVVVGCHHDSWNFGAADATSGLITVFEAARAFAAARDAGFVPRRSIVFAAWAAEEFGILGSAEWVEANVERLRSKGVAYINLDMASMGLDFRSSASPLLHDVIRRAARLVEHPAFDDGRSVHEVWSHSGFAAEPGEPAREPTLGSLGGGSDHVGFLALGLVPSASLSGGGSRGDAYHSNYDHLAWYRRIVGEDYRAAGMITRMAIATAALLADEAILPYDVGALGTEFQGHLRSLTQRGRQLGFFPPGDAVCDRALTGLWRAAGAIGTGAALAELSDDARNARLLGLERRFHLEAGLPGRPWFQNLFVAPDETTGYEAWMLPLLRYHVEQGDRKGFEGAVARYRRLLDELARDVR